MSSSSRFRRLERGFKETDEIAIAGHIKPAPGEEAQASQGCHDQGPPWAPAKQPQSQRECHQMRRGTPGEHPAESQPLEQHPFPGGLSCLAKLGEKNQGPKSDAAMLPDSHGECREHGRTRTGKRVPIQADVGKPNKYEQKKKPQARAGRTDWPCISVSDRGLGKDRNSLPPIDRSKPPARQLVRDPRDNWNTHGRKCAPGSHSMIREFPGSPIRANPETHCIPGCLRAPGFPRQGRPQCYLRLVTWCW